MNDIGMVNMMARGCTSELKSMEVVKNMMAITSRSSQ